jgi:hypothetical protein
MLVKNGVRFAFQLTGFAREDGGVRDVQGLEVTAAPCTVALGALGQAQPTRLAQKLHAERLLVVVPVDARPALLTPRDAQVAPAALLQGDAPPFPTPGSSAVEHQPRLPALRARLNVNGTLLANGRTRLPVLVILRRDSTVPGLFPFQLHHRQNTLENLQCHTVQAPNPKLRQSRHTLRLHLHHPQHSLRTHPRASRKIQLKSKPTSP